MTQIVSPKTNITAARIVEEARSWLGCRWRHQGRVRRVYAPGGYLGAVDCIGLVVCVADRVGILPEGFKDDRNYPPNPDGVRLRAGLEKFLIPHSGELFPGLVLLFCRRGDSFPVHVGITGDYPGGLSLIHAFVEVQKVVEHRLDQEWIDLVVCAYRLPGVIY